MTLPSGYTRLAARLDTWASNATESTRAEYVSALGAFLERTRKARRGGLLLMLSTAIVSAARLQGEHVAGPVSVVNVLTTGAIAAALPIAYALGLRRWCVGHVAHELASATFRVLLRRQDVGATGLEVHAPLLPPESLASGDLLRWGLGNKDSAWQRWTLRADAVVGLSAVVVVVIGGPVLCTKAAQMASSPWGVIGSVLGGLLVLTALRPFEALRGVLSDERARL